MSDATEMRVAPLEIVPRYGWFFVFDRTKLLAQFRTREAAEQFIRNQSKD